MNIKVANALLIPLSVVFFLAAMMARIESHEEHQFIRVLDVVIGLMFAVSFVLTLSVNPVRWRPALIVALPIWLMVSGSLVSLHEFQVYARICAAEHGITRGRVLKSYEALTAYLRDCGSFPSEAQGLDALFVNPGVTQWKGPYLSDKDLISDVWGHPLRYAVRNKTPVIWSCGKDGISGTTDDINIEHEDARKFRAQP